MCRVPRQCLGDIYAMDVAYRTGSFSYRPKNVFLQRMCYTDAEITEVVDALLLFPNGATGVHLNDNLLTDATGVKKSPSLLPRAPQFASCA